MSSKYLATVLQNDCSIFYSFALSFSHRIKISILTNTSVLRGSRAQTPATCTLCSRSPPLFPRQPEPQPPRCNGHVGPQPEGRWAVLHAEAPAGDAVSSCRRRRDRLAGWGADEVEAAAGAVAEAGGERVGEEEQEQPRGRRGVQGQGFLFG